jgi:hypothetical protein
MSDKQSEISWKSSVAKQDAHGAKIYSRLTQLCNKMCVSIQASKAKYVAWHWFSCNNSQKTKQKQLEKVAEDYGLSTSH